MTDQANKKQVPAEDKAKKAVTTDVNGGTKAEEKGHVHGSGGCCCGGGCGCC